MRRIGGYLASGILALLGLLHVYWALGGRAGKDVMLPTQAGKKLLSPTPAQTWAVAFALFGAATTLLGRLGHGGSSWPPVRFRWCTRAISLLFFLRAIGDFRMVGFGKTIVGTAFARWDTWLFSPLCLCLAALTALADRLPVGGD